MTYTLSRNTFGALALPFLVAACGGGSGDAGPSQPTVMAPLVQQLAAQAAQAAQAAAAEDTVQHSAPAPAGDTVYSIINLGSEAGMIAALNGRGQALFGNFGNDGVRNAFFDGERIHEIGSLGGGYTISWGLNDNGVVVGESEDNHQPHSNIRAVTWTVSEGMRPLQGGFLAQGRAINNARQVAGNADADGLSTQAARWDADGVLRRLGPRPESLSQASAINVDGLSAGFADLPSGAIHAVRWAANGAQLDLGTLGGSGAFAERINGRGHVAGVSDSADGRLLAFFWSPRSGMVPLGAEGGGVRLVSGLNDRGEVAGNAQDGELSKPYLWTRRGGLAPLPLAGAAQGDVFALGEQGQMVGALQSGPDWRSQRAVRWPGVAKPIELNGRLHRAPSGLHLYAGAAINNDGAILAHSNAGLVLLRPGKRGTNAPVLGPWQGLPDTITVGDSFSLKLGFTDNSTTETHQAAIDWGDGCASSAPKVRESGGVGDVSVNHTFCAAGFYTIKVRVSDSGGRATIVRRDVFVEDPAVAAVSGRGTLDAGAGSTRPLQFALWAPLGAQARPHPAARSAPFVALAGAFHFRSTSVERVQRDGGVVRIEGVGSRNGRPGYRFLVEAVDGGGADRLRVTLTRRDSAGAAQVTAYDSAAALPSSRAAGAAAMRAGESAPARTAGTPVVFGGIAVRD